MFIEERFGENFYKTLPLGYHNDANFCFDQIFWTHDYYPHQNLELWCPVVDANEPTKTMASRSASEWIVNRSYHRRCLLFRCVFVIRFSCRFLSAPPGLPSSWQLNGCPGEPAFSQHLGGELLLQFTISP